MVIQRVVGHMSRVIGLTQSNGRTNVANVLLASDVLLKGEVIAIPTDTIYGLAVSALNDSAIDRLYQLKNRDVSKPIAICVSDVDQMAQWCHLTVGSDLLNELLPGPVTLVFERSPNLNKNLNPNHKLIGIRIPNHEFVRDLCRLCGPLGLTSANISSEASCLTVNEFIHLWPKLSAVFDGGPLGGSDPKRLGSTVVDLSVKGCFKIIRSGCAFTQTANLLQNKFKLTQI